MSAEPAAVALAAAVVVTWVLAARLRARLARRRAAGPTDLVSSGPQIVYFSSAGCLTCRTRQEPALASLPGATVRKLDAIADATLAARFHVYTVPTTIVLAADGRVVDVNYGFASATRLAAQLERAAGSGPAR